MFLYSIILIIYTLTDNNLSLSLSRLLCGVWQHCGWPTPSCLSCVSTTPTASTSAGPACPGRRSISSVTLPPPQAHQDQTGAHPHPHNPYQQHPASSLSKPLMPMELHAATHYEGWKSIWNKEAKNVLIQETGLQFVVWLNPCLNPFEFLWIPSLITLHYQHPVFLLNPKTFVLLNLITTTIHHLL